jgi:hypothetical protein
MSPIAYLFYEEALDDLVRIRDAEEGANTADRLHAIKYSALDAEHLQQLGRREPPPGTGPFIIQMISGKRHAYTGDHFQEWIQEYMEYLLRPPPEPVPDRGAHIRSTMSTGRINAKEFTAPPAPMPKSTTKVSTTGNRGPGTDVGEASTLIQLMDPDAFLEDFEQNGAAMQGQR